MEGATETDSFGRNWESVGLQLLNVRAYWYGPRWTTPEIRIPEPVSFFGTFPPRFSTSRALGENIPIQVEGRVETWARIDAGGPASAVHITAPGLSVTTGPLGNGERFTFDTHPHPLRQAALFEGVEDWSRIDPSTTLAPLRPGRQLITIDLVGATSASWAKVSGDSLFLGPW
jgi:hypothetical protein